MICAAIHVSSEALLVSLSAKTKTESSRSNQSPTLSVLRTGGLVIDIAHTTPNLRIERTVSDVEFMAIRSPPWALISRSSLYRTSMAARVDCCPLILAVWAVYVR